MAGLKLFLANMMVGCMVFFLASRSLIITVAAQDDDPQTLELAHGCSPESYRYVNKTAFQDNLDTAFASLASNISSSNASFFATSDSMKGNTDKVHALLLCRKYLTSQECLQCFTEAEKRLKQYCSDEGFNGGKIHLDGCLLHYENATFLEVGTDPGFSNTCASVYDTKPKEFNQTTDILLSQLTTNASTSGDWYAQGVFSIASTHVYGVAQCVPTLSNSTCQDCLNSVETLVVNNCLPQQEGRGLQAGCFMRYATYPFYSNFNSTTPDLTSSKKKSKTWAILLGSIGGAWAILFYFYLETFLWEVNVRPTQPHFINGGVTTSKPPSSMSTSTSTKESTQFYGT